MIRAIELFCGIGGFAAAVADFDIKIVGAFDQNPAAVETYRYNFPRHSVQSKDIVKMNPWELTAPAAEFWWLSPPCQPYCERGSKLDLDDPRSNSLIRIMDMLKRIPEEKLPVSLALENVAGFTRSEARKQLLNLLDERRYNLAELLLCPTELGVPSRRPRYYLAASRLPLNTPDQPPRQHSCSITLGDYLARFDPAELPPELKLSGSSFARFGKGLRILDPHDRSACTTCFTSGYGRSLVNAGSYLHCGDSVRYFTPEEIVRLLHFPPSFCFPEKLTLRQRWHLAGNSLSVVAVREVLRLFTAFAMVEGPPNRTGL